MTNRALAKRAAAVFQWTERMYTLTGHTVVRVDGYGNGEVLLLHGGGDGKGSWESSLDHLPDTADDATRGRMLGQLRKALGDSGAVAWRAKTTKGKPDYWEVSNCPAVLPCILYGSGNTEAEALISAMEAHKA